MRETLEDITGGAHAMSEIDFTRRVVRRFGLPEPDRQVPRRDARGKRRWLDVVWEQAGLIVEVDGAAHMDVLQYWDDMDRGNDFTLKHYRILRYAAFVVRCQPEYVASQIRQALREAGYSC
jgi:very-short-patch-repair endonuclease